MTFIGFLNEESPKGWNGVFTRARLPWMLVKKYDQPFDESLPFVRVFINQNTGH